MANCALSAGEENCAPAYQSLAGRSCIHNDLGSGLSTTARSSAVSCPSAMPLSSTVPKPIRRTRKR